MLRVVHRCRKHVAPRLYDKLDAGDQAGAGGYARRYAFMAHVPYHERIN